MFGEHESESPRVPSPWDSLISSPRSISPSKLSSSLSVNDIQSSISIPSINLLASPLLLPRLVPENDDGNVEYKLQLLNPSPARFARLVTQLKWRLLEGGGQAYYELGVADSGDLVGLGRAELESSLDTLEMMAGEIGASVIVVKEIEVPAELAAQYKEDAKTHGNWNSWGDARGKRAKKRAKGLLSYEDDAVSSSMISTSTSYTSTSTTNTETEEDNGGFDNEDYHEMEMTVVLQKPSISSQSTTTNANNVNSSDSLAMFTMDSDPESDSADVADISETETLPPTPQYAVDLEISSVYKPRPMSKRFLQIQSGHQHSVSGRLDSGKGAKRGKVKYNHHNHNPHTKKKDTASSLSMGQMNEEGGGDVDGDVESSSSHPSNNKSTNKSLNRRQARDRKREERKQALLTLAVREVVEQTTTTTSTSTTVSGIGMVNGNSLELDDITPTQTHSEVQENADDLVEKLESLHVNVEQTYLMTGSSTSTSTSTSQSQPTTTIETVTSIMNQVTASLDNNTITTDNKSITNGLASNHNHNHNHNHTHTYTSDSENGNHGIGVLVDENGDGIDVGVNADVDIDVDIKGEDDDKDLFASPTTRINNFTQNTNDVSSTDGKAPPRLIVEVLVVRKMLIEEGFLDFESFSFI